MVAAWNLPSLVHDKFLLAQQSKDLTFYAAQLTILQCDGFPLQLRYSPALASKPRPTIPADSSSKPVNPFEHPAKGLLIAELPFHNLLLNKFPVVPDHFILATKEFKEQTQLLGEADIEAAYECIKAYRDGDEDLFAFFNSGEHSGASQRHRHIQFLPARSMRIGMGEDDEWSILADRLVDSKAALPFRYFSVALPKNPSAEELHITYISLYHDAVAASGLSRRSDINNGEIVENESLISYNLGITPRSMVLCPRAAEGKMITGSTGNAVGMVCLNGTILGGTLLVKAKDEWNALLHDSTQLKKILLHIGIRSSTSL